MAQRIRGFAALAVFAGLAAAGAALARGPDMNLPIFGPATESWRESPAPETYEQPSAPRRTKPRSASAFGVGAPVCVRLCDGFFFPTASVSGGEAACAAQCPDAPTALYTMATDKIDDAVSSTGERYTKLPVAKRYQTHYEATCTCRRDAVASRAKELLTDSTLQRGDVVMTSEGFRVYEGGGYGPSGPRDFVALSKASNVAKDKRATLTAMEKAGSGSPALASPRVVVARPKGNVTVDSGAPAPAD